jgi:hypothetical protein
VQAVRGKAEEGGELELAYHACTANGAIELCHDEWRGATGTGLGDKWHVGYSNAGMIAKIFLFVKIFDNLQNILVATKFIDYWASRCGKEQNQGINYPYSFSPCTLGL